MEELSDLRTQKIKIKYNWPLAKTLKLGIKIA
jgi:hypothetical protein